VTTEIFPDVCLRVRENGEKKKTVIEERREEYVYRKPPNQREK
jgi:hypothetical protein